MCAWPCTTQKGNPADPYGVWLENGDKSYVGSWPDLGGAFGLQWEGRPELGSMAPWEKAHFISEKLHTGHYVIMKIETPPDEQHWVVVVGTQMAQPPYTDGSGYPAEYWDQQFTIHEPAWNGGQGGPTIPWPNNCKGATLADVPRVALYKKQ